jgi:F5/8 type C domain
MYPVTSAFRDAIVSCDQAAVIKATVVLDDSELGDLPVTSGSVDCDGTRDGALRSLALTLSPDSRAYDWLAAAGAEIVVKRGLTLPVTGFDYIANLIPAMTSNTAPSGVASASSEYDPNYAAWKAFDKAGYSQRWCTAGTTAGWLQYQFASAHTVTSYAITSPSNVGDGVPKSWTFKGSNDGAAWTTLDTRTNIVDWAALANTRKVFDFTNATAYAYYRLDITASNAAPYLAVGELEMIEMVTVAGTLREELVPLGVFVLDADLEEAEDGTLTVSAADRSRRISRARWTDPYIVAAGLNVGDALADLLTTCWADCPIGSTLTAIDKVTGAKAVYLDGADSDPWKDARELAASSGHDLYFDAEGVVQVRDTPDPQSDPVCFTYYAGDEGVVLSRTRTLKLSQLYNGVIAIAEGSGVAVPKRGEAWDDDPNSPTYCDGPMGRVPLWYSSPLLTTQDDVDSAAPTRLARVKRPIEQVTFTLLPNPAHEAFDVVEFVDENDVARRFMFDIVSIPLDSAGSLTATTRETEVT